MDCQMYRGVASAQVVQRQRCTTHAPTGAYHLGAYRADGFGMVNLALDNPALSFPAVSSW